MTGERAPFDGDQVALEHAVSGGDDTAELIAQIRALAAHDPAVRQVVTDVLAQLDRVVGAAVRDRLPDEATAPGPALPGGAAPTSSS